MIIEGNPMKLLQYDDNYNTHICRKHKEKMSSFPMSFISFFIAILVYN